MNSFLFRIFVPSTQGTTSPVLKSEHEARTEKVSTFFSSLFDGATVIPDCNGAWLSDTHGLVIENVSIVESGGSIESLEQVKTFCESLKNDWKQEAILLQIVPVTNFFI